MSIATDGWHEEKVFITVKTYPTPSAKYQETVCTAGITGDGHWVRIYPIRFRFLEDPKQYKKYAWIQARIKRNSEHDFRPDSFKIDEDSIQVLDSVNTKNHWQKRNDIILPTVSQSLEELSARYNDTHLSLGIFKPHEVLDFIREDDPLSSRAKKNEHLRQSSLFSDDPPPDLELIPHKFSYRFRCMDEKCNGHKIIILDWEIYTAYFMWKRKYGELGALEKIRERWLETLCSPKKDTYFIVGTQFPNPTFMILGVYWPPKSSGTQLSLF